MAPRCGPRSRARPASPAFVSWRGGQDARRWRHLSQGQQGDRQTLALEHQINYCRTERMKAKPERNGKPRTCWAFHLRDAPVARPADECLGRTARPKPFSRRATKLYNTRRGQLNAACIHCHELNSGNYIRADLFRKAASTASRSTGLKWGRPGSIHYRMEECYSQVRAIAGAVRVRGADHAAALRRLAFQRPAESKRPAVRR